MSMNTTYLITRKMKTRKITLFMTGLLFVSLCMGQDLELKTNGYGEKKLKKYPKKVFIKDFNVNFQMTANAKAQSKSTTNSSRGSSSASMNVAVTGVEATDLQNITNAAYKDLVAKFESNGFEVVTASEVGKLAAFEDHELMESNINEDQNPGYLKVTPEGFTYYVKGISKKGKEKGMPGAVPMKLLKETENDYLVVSANYAFSSIYLVSKESDGLGISSVKGKIGLKMQGCNINAWGGRYSAIAYTPKKTPEFEGVFEGEGEKLRAFSAGTAPSYDGFMTHSSTNYTHQAQNIGNKYQTTTEQALKDFNNLALEDLFSYFGG